MKELQLTSVTKLGYYYALRNETKIDIIDYVYNAFPNDEERENTFIAIRNEYHKTVSSMKLSGQKPIPVKIKAHLTTSILAPIYKKFTGKDLVPQHSFREKSDKKPDAPKTSQVEGVPNTSLSSESPKVEVSSEEEMKRKIMKKEDINLEPEIPLTPEEKETLFKNIPDSEIMPDSISEEELEERNKQAQSTQMESMFGDVEEGDDLIISETSDEDEEDKNDLGDLASKITTCFD